MKFNETFKNGTIKHILVPEISEPSFYSVVIQCFAGAHSKGPALETSNSQNLTCHESFSDMCGTFSAVGRFSDVGLLVPWDV